MPTSRHARTRVSPISWALPGVTVAALLLAGCASTPTVPRELRAPSDATDCAREQCIDFVYLHGTQRHSEEQRDGFFEYVDPLHDWVMAELHTRPEVHAGLLNGDRLRINPVPVKFYWGDMSSEALGQAETLMSWSDAQQGKPGPLSALAQRYFIMGTHDTYWITELQNKRKVNLALHEVISESLVQGRQTVLFGHSAGAVVIQAYAMYHLPYLDLAELARYASKAEVKSLFGGASQPTCVQALLESGLVEFLHTGDLALRLEWESSQDMDRLTTFRRAFWYEKIRQLPEYTRQYCAPADAVRGIVTYGHPGLILHGTLTGPERDIFLLFLRYIFENEFFWINIVHTNDPVGYALYDAEHVPDAVEERLSMPVRRGGGFIVNGAERAGASVFTAHSWYWMRPDQFARVLAEAYATGYQRRFRETGN